MKGDDYERRFMDAGEALYREKHVARLFTGILMFFGLLPLFVGVATTFTAAPWFAALGPIAVSALILLIALYFAVMRTTVTHEHVTVAYGTLGEKIPIASITDCKREGMIGMGPKYGPGGWRYAPLGTTDGVRVSWTRNGKTKSCYIGASDADALARAIDRARARVRVDPARSEALAEEVAHEQGQEAHDQSRG